jgi:hypothetical protein
MGEEVETAIREKVALNSINICVAMCTKHLSQNFTAIM